MKNKLTALLLACSLGLTLCACGGRAETSAAESSPEASATLPVISAAPSVESEPTPEIVETGDLPTDRTYEVYSAFDYGDGLAIIRFGDTATNMYFGLVDKTGTVRYCYHLGDTNGSGVTTAVPFKDGVGYLVNEPMLYEIDTTGTVLRSFPYVRNFYQNENDGIACAIAYGDGYIVTEMIERGFDGMTYTYCLYDRENNETVLFPQGAQPYLVSYLGNGNFLFGGAADIYSAKTGKWLSELTGGSDEKLEAFSAWGFDDCVVYATKVKSGYDKIGIIDKDGNVSETSIPDQFMEINMVGAGDGLAVFYIAPKYSSPDYIFYIYNAAAGTVTPYTGQYAEAANGNFKGSINLIHDGLVGIPVWGRDGQPYVAFLDKDLNEIGEPVQMDPYFTYLGDYLMTSDSGDFLASNVYDLDHNLLYSKQLVSEGDGVLRESNGKANYFQYDGTPLFDEIDYSAAKLIELP